MVSQLAIKILSQTASSSGCERNWSVFERIHTRKRNKLEHKRLNDLVYVHYNLGLKDREVNKRRTLDPVDYESMENIEFWITEEEEETPLIDYDEIEKMFYYDLSNPILDLTKDDEGMVEGQNITIDGELNLDSFPQEDVDSYTQSTSLTNNVNLGSNQDNDTWMN
ncbi:putative HAT dimerization domain, ribonuclease H-like domain-containing protein [Lupinus albus]|uniref:Putative HAT dimerization domain, ribonuclease H-like domain-containing protein n=1 Tax=Lupinus albus TaxID=3870 RepID=A0A6A4QMC2_LUPAL|nr:putative HAT dimerization domain, ribonuclease H-like domain-containing protein [Lupinus albus]